MENIQDHVQLIISLLTLFGFGIAAYKFSKDPDELIKSRQDIVETKQEAMDKYIAHFIEDVKIIKENHLRHIEGDISNIKGDIKEIKNAINFLKK